MVHTLAGLPFIHPVPAFRFPHLGCPTSIGRMSQMLKSSGAMGAATLASRLLGLVREQVYARFMGDTAEASAFKLAFQVPNLFRRLLGEGALTAAFIPIFKAKEKTEGEAAMWRAANAVLSGLVIVVAGIVALAALAVTVVLEVTKVHYTQAGVPVFPSSPIPFLQSDTRLMLELLRLMFPYLLLVCLAALCMTSVLMAIAFNGIARASTEVTSDLTMPKATPPPRPLLRIG